MDLWSQPFIFFFPRELFGWTKMSLEKACFANSSKTLKVFTLEKSSPLGEHSSHAVSIGIWKVYGSSARILC